MEFFLDTADVDEIREIAAWGILDGVTTNLLHPNGEEQDARLVRRSGR